MELAGNVAEMVVSAGGSTGRTYEGTHGDGTLTTASGDEGNATNTDWPGIDGTTSKGVTGAKGGTGTRGGSYATSNTLLLAISDRTSEPDGLSVRGPRIGGRLARTAKQLSTVIYISTAAQNGDFDGYGGSSNARDGWDFFCEDKKPANLPGDCTHIHAFISVSATDEIRDMDTLYGYDRTAPVYWWHNTNYAFYKLATDWEDMLDNSILITQSDGTGLSGSVWTGAQANGNVWSGRNCAGWTDGTSASIARRGSGTTTGEQWLTTGDDNCDQAWPEIRCACQYEVED
jgi:hypothetical protein